MLSWLEYALHGSFANRNHNVDEPGHYCVLLIRIAHNLFTNGTTLVHAILTVVGTYIMELCDVDLRDSFNNETRFI